MKKIAIGDLIPGKVGTPLPTTGRNHAPMDGDVPMTQEDEEHHPTAGAGEDPLTSPPPLPERWKERIRALPGASQIHIPSAVREKVCIEWIKCLLGMVHPDEAIRGKWWEIEEGRTKLVLCNIKRGDHVPKEVAIRNMLWKEGKLEELLRRAEMAYFVAPTKRKAKKRRTTKEGGEGLPESKRNAIIKMVQE